MARRPWDRSWYSEERAGRCDHSGEIEEPWDKERELVVGGVFVFVTGYGACVCWPYRAV